MTPQQAAENIRRITTEIYSFSLIHNLRVRYHLETKDRKEEKIQGQCFHPSPPPT